MSFHGNSTWNAITLVASGLPSQPFSPGLSLLLPLPRSPNPSLIPAGWQLILLRLEPGLWDLRYDLSHDHLHLKKGHRQQCGDGVGGGREGVAKGGMQMGDIIIVLAIKIKNSWGKAAFTREDCRPSDRQEASFLAFFSCFRGCP